MRECKTAMCPPKRLRISELNPHLLCALCGGYLIDATTIIECLHSFCKTCILSYLGTSNYCPICEVLIHKTRPWQNIRLDHALQNAVYKMVPGLFQNEMKRRREFYEQHHLPDKYGQIVGHSQGQTGDRIIFSQDEEFSVSIEFSPDGKPVTETKTKQLKRPLDTRQHDKRYLKCPAGLRVEHLKKFIRLKFTLPQHIEIDLFYESEPLYDSYSLMDIAYIYLWKRDCVLQLFYSFFEVPAKKRKLQSIIHISEIVSKSKQFFDKPQKNFGDRKSSNKKEKSDSKKQSRISGKKKGTVKTITSSTSPVFIAPHEDIIVAKGAVSSSLKRKHPESSTSKDSSCLSRSRTSTLGTPACLKKVKRVDNLAPVECSSVPAACQPVPTQSPASSDRSVSPQLCRESTNCSIISHHSTERTTCSVTSHFCTDNTQCSIVTHPRVTHSNRNSKSPADSEVSITLLIKSSESNDYQHITQSSPRCTPGRLQNGENTSEITYNSFLNGDTLSAIRDKNGKFLKVKNTFLKKCKKESKMTKMNIQNGELVSEVQVKVNGKIAPELTNKQLVNGQFIFRLQNGKITNGEVSSKASDKKNRCSELSVVNTKCESVGKGNEVRSIKRSRNVSCAKHSVRKASDTIFEQKDTKVNLVQSPVKNIQDETKDCHNLRNNCFHNGERVLGEKLDVDRISEVEDRFSNGDIVFDMKDKDVKDKKVEIDNNLYDKMFERTDVTSDFKDRKLIIVDVMDALKDEKLPQSEMDSLVKDTILVRRGVKPTAGSFHQASSDTNPCPVKPEDTVLPVSSQIDDIGAEDKKLATGSEKPGLNLTYDGHTNLMEGVPSLPQSTASDPDKSLEISAASQVLHSETCVDTEQVVSTTGPGDSAAAGSDNRKNLCQDTNRDNVVGLKHLLSNRPASSPVRSPANSPVRSPANSPASSPVSSPVRSPASSSAHVQKHFNAKSETSKRLHTQPRAPSDKDILGGQTNETEIYLRSQSPCAIGKVNIQLGNTENVNTDVASSARTNSLSRQLPSEGNSHFPDRTILILPSLCSTKPTSVDKTCNSAPETASAIKTISTEHKTWKDPAPTVVAQKVGLDNRTGDSIDEHSTANKVKKNGEECRKQGYSPVVSNDMSGSGHTSGHAIEKHINFSESANKISNNVHKVNLQSVKVQAKRASAASSGKQPTNSDVSSETSSGKPPTNNDVSSETSSGKPPTNNDVSSETSSATPVPFKLVQPTVASITSVAASAVASSLSFTASVLPANSNCLISSSSGKTSSLSSTSSSSLTTPTATVKTNSCGTKSLPAKSSSPKPRMTATVAANEIVDAVARSSVAITSPQPRMTATVAANKTVDAVARSSVAITSPASQNKCHSHQIEGRNDLGSKQTVSGGILNTPPLPQDVPPDVITSAFTPTNGSLEVAPLRVSGSNSIPFTSASSNNNAALAACVVSSFLNLPPAKTSPKKRPQPRSNPHSNKSSTDLILPSEATKLENFLFDVKSPEKELSDSYSQNRVSSSCGKETQKSHFRTKLNSELGIGMNKSPKTVESHTTGVHHLPKTISQTSRPSSTVRSVSTSLSPNTTYNNNIIHTTKISTLIPKSNSVSSKAGIFTKPSSYSANVNSLLLSRNILNNSLASHYQRVDGLLAIRGASCIPQELTSKPSAISSSSSSTPSTSHHKMSSTAKHSSKGTSGRSDKSPKHRTIPPLCIPKSSLIGPTTLKLQRSPRSNDHYIFSPLLHYDPSSQQKVHRTKSTESKHRTSHSHKTVLPGSKGTGTSASKQRVPSIKISDINRNPVIVENVGSGNSSNNNAHCQYPYKTYNHSASKSSALQNGTPRAHSRGRNEANSSAGRHDKMPVRDILRPSDSELLLSRHWHAYSTAELLFSGFSLPAHSKLHDLQYDTDAMPLDYSQSSSKS